MTHSVFHEEWTERPGERAHKEHRHDQVIMSIPHTGEENCPYYGPQECSCYTNANASQQDFERVQSILLLDSIPITFFL